MTVVVICYRGCRKLAQVCARQHSDQQWDARMTVVPWIILLSDIAGIVFLLYGVCKMLSSPICSLISQTAVLLLSKS